MQKSRLFYSIIPISLSLIFANSAIAATPFISNEQDGFIYIQDGLSPGQRITWVLLEVLVIRTVTANNCGVAVFPKPSAKIPLTSSILIDPMNEGPNIQRSFAPVGVIPKCVFKNGAFSLTSPLSQSIVSSSGQYALIGNMPNEAISYAFEGDLKKQSATADKCGFVKTKIQGIMSLDADNPRFLEQKVPMKCIGGIRYRKA